MDEQKVKEAYKELAKFRQPARCPNVDRKIELAGTFDIAFIDVDLHDDNGIARIGVIRGIPAELSYPPH